MKVLANEVRSLLDRLYNLRGEDSVILVKMNKERQEAIETQERTKNEKEILISEIEKLTNEEKTLASEGEKLTSVLSNINKDDFSNVLERLGIDFNPDLISEKVNSMLPDTIAKVVEENKKASEKLKDVEAEMNNAITKVEELGIRKDEALNAQAKLNEYFNLALAGNINITRDEITNLLEKFDFNDNEQREAAKLLMFPEDALYEYDAGYKSGNQTSGRTISEVIAEAKKESVVEDTSSDEIKSVEISSNKDSVLEDIFDKVIEENTIPEISKPEAEEAKEEIKESNINESEKLKNLLDSLGFNSNGFSTTSLKKLLANYDEELFKQNVDYIKAKNIDLSILEENVELLFDKELKMKIEKLLELGKDAKDINLTPKVLLKYNLQGLNNTINVLQISGLDPKKVPLMAY